MSETKNGGRKPPRKKKRIFRKIILFLLVVLIVGGIGVYTWAKLRDQYTVTYDEYTATTGTISNSLSFTGSVALRDSAAYTASSDATVRNVYVHNGDAVKKDDRLVRLSNGTTVTAGFNGTVNMVSVEVGDEVSAGDTLIEIADFEHMEVSFRVDEYDISDVHVGETCSITATATERTFESTVSKINYISSSTGNVAYYTATAYLDIADGGIYPGMQVTVTIPQEEAKDVVILKADALSFTMENQAFVYKKTGEGDELEEVTVEVGVSNGNYVEIKSGLASGETVYAVTKAKEDSLTNLFSSMFSQRQFNNRQMPGGDRNWNRDSNQTPSRNNNGGSNGGGR